MVKNPPANAGGTSLIPGSGKSPGEGNHHPLQYSCLGNPMDRGDLVGSKLTGYELVFYSLWGTVSLPRGGQVPLPGGIRGHLGVEAFTSTVHQAGAPAQLCGGSQGGSDEAPAQQGPHH